MRHVSILPTRDNSMQLSFGSSYGSVTVFGYLYDLPRSSSLALPLLDSEGQGGGKGGEYAAPGVVSSLGRT